MGRLFDTDNIVWRFLGRVADLVILNFLFLLCSIPIVTIGASWTALYSVTLKAVKNEESYIAKGFLEGFKENFKQSTICLSDDCNVYFPLYCTISRDNEADFQKCSVDRYRQFSVHITSFWSQYFSTVCDVFQCTGNDHSTCILVHDWIFVSGICHIVYLPEDLFEI